MGVSAFAWCWNGSIPTELREAPCVSWTLARCLGMMGSGEDSMDAKQYGMAIFGPFQPPGMRRGGVFGISAFPWCWNGSFPTELREAPCVSSTLVRCLG